MCALFVVGASRFFGLYRRKKKIGQKSKTLAWPREERSECFCVLVS